MSRQPEEGKRTWGADLASTVGRVRRVLPIIARRHKVMLLVGLLLMVASGGLGTAVPVLFGTLVNRLADALNEGSGEGAFGAAAPFLVLIGSAYLLSQLLIVAQRWLVEAACTRIERDLTVVSVSHLLKVELGAQAGQRVGALHGRIFRGVDGLILFLTIVFRDLLAGLIGIVCALVYVFVVDYRIGLVMLASLPVAIALTLRESAAQFDTRRAVLRSREHLDGAVIERLGAIEYIRAVNTGSQEVDQIERVAENQRQQKMVQQTQLAVHETYKTLNEGAFYLLILAVAVYLVSRHAAYPLSGQAIQPGDLITYSMLFYRVVVPLKSIWYMLDHLQECNLRVDDLLQLLAQAPDPSFAILQSRKLTMQGRVAELYHWKERPSPPPGPGREPRLVKGAPLLVVSDLVVHYPGPDGAVRPALRGMSLTVAHGQTIGVAGPAGSGKSTWLKVLLRLVPPAAGMVHVGGVPLGELDRETISRLFGYVSQTPFLFAGTIRENLAYGMPAVSDDAVRRAAQMARIHEEIMAMPAGYDSPVAEGGRNLSGGQRQRIALARVFLQGPPILLLDEATSALDNINEKAIRDALAATRAGRTTIIVAHRLTTLNDADEIVVFDQGLIVERGSYEALSEGNGLFARLVQSAAHKAIAAEFSQGQTSVPGAPLKPPQALGRFFVTDCLGSGAMGRVYRAYDTALCRDVALKIPRAEVLAAPGGAEDFLEEARAAARLRHLNFCAIHDVRCEEGAPCIVLDFVDGQPLHPEWSGGNAAVAARLAHTLASALAVAHHQGVVHRDLKPANVLMRPDRTPVITDFGLALRLDTPDTRPPAPGELAGTFAYMAPEQIEPHRAAIGPATDIYALGVLLYEQLTGRPPFVADNMMALFDRVLHARPEPPSRHRPGLAPALDAICLRALAKHPGDRFADMTEFAAALADFLLSGEGGVSLAPVSAITFPPPPVRPEVVRFAFVGVGSQAPASPARQDRLYLDVGNALGPAVLDHHHLTGALGSTASLVLTRPALVAAAVNPHRRAEDVFTVVLHEHPDLDGVTAAYFALHYLETGDFPAGAAELARYVDRIDAGYPGMSLAAPFSLYVAYRRLGERLAEQSWDSPALAWQQQVREALVLLADVVREAAQTGRPLSEVDAFACGDRFNAADRQAVFADVDRYRVKLADPRCAARRARLLLPGRFGGKEPAEALLVRDVSSSDDPGRCVFFKDWARSDAESCGTGEGFTGLSVFLSAPARRCILSVAPGRGVSLRGLGALLERAESERRRQVFGMDDRKIDPATSAPRPARTGYDNADPWYDGRAHGYTIVDAPRAGTLLHAEEIEAIFLRFGGWEGPAEPLGH
jgi:ATP-binding cassette subfamily B protein